MKWLLLLFLSFLSAQVILVCHMSETTIAIHSPKELINFEVCDFITYMEIKISLFLLRKAMRIRQR